MQLLRRHAYGTNSDVLLAQYGNAMTKVRDALDAVRAIDVNSRDYYVIGHNACAEAHQEHQARLVALNNLRAVADRGEHQRPGGGPQGPRSGGDGAVMRAIALVLVIATPAWAANDTTEEWREEWLEKSRVCARLPGGNPWICSMHHTPDERVAAAVANFVLQKCGEVEGLSATNAARSAPTSSSAGVTDGQASS